MPSRREIEERVVVLSERHSGREFAAAVRRYSEELDAAERELLGEVLLERARAQGAFDRAAILRIDAHGWFRRQWNRLDPTRFRS